MGRASPRLTKSGEAEDAGRTRGHLHERGGFAEVGRVFKNTSHQGSALGSRRVGYHPWGCFAPPPYSGSAFPPSGALRRTPPSTTYFGLVSADLGFSHEGFS